MANLKSADVVESSSAYVGRFAPSPTGPLHLGSLVAAVASYLDARAHGGRWLLRIEDVDQTRNQLGAQNDIVETLARFGFEWDGELLVQSDRHHRYRFILDDLIERGYVYPCSCSRREVAIYGRQGLDGLIYPGICRLGVRKTNVPHSWRLRVDGGLIVFADLIQGVFAQDVQQTVGDYVLLRADGCWAYQLAVVVDDAECGVTHVVRGSDLLDSTARQIGLQRVLNYPTVTYAHLPVLANLQGEKLSKQTKAEPLFAGAESEQLFFALEFLGHEPPAELRGAPLALLWQWALGSWDLTRIPQKRSVSVTFEHKNEYKILL
ncbi:MULTISPECIES: tRNA glutamyl-Q(34) synthetase GluQRS [Deefgea]|uniref:Glutamyl-Q tRNA(Asp) synthetase n=1 Tax=Deefgea chitinilytica TaxID=570276 RepID=A0ABS2C889_9NEIS|nr:MULTISPECIES: tRNA glutamyl-Q(34) synthetase GluQRS [Deefgea]MBM5570377.1 tRNA glutamyl-Q(34) synthetase GluQRS [Deefgea chitinilytica]MBM9887606.1 tRNA glutamyl-Q(34) synthetase GluQRS [Deefgea sp. CFH1-16]